MARRGGHGPIPKRLWTFDTEATVLSMTGSQCHGQMENDVRRDCQRAANRGDIDLMSGCYDGLLARPLLMSG